MSKKEFLTLKRQIGKLLEKAEQEALEEGVNITSTEFQLVFREFKRKILAERGISLEEYERLEEELRTADTTLVDKYSLIKIGKGLEKETKEEKERTDKKIKEIQEEYLAKIDALRGEEDSKIQVLTEKTDAEKKELSGEIKTLVGEVGKQQNILGKQIGELKKLEERFFREAISKDREIDEMKDSAKQIPEMINNMGKKIEGEISKLPKPLTPEDVAKLREERKKEITKEIKGYIGNWYQLPVRGLRISTQRNLDAFKAGFIDGETPTGLINGSNKTFTLAYAPNPTTSLKVYRNGIRQELTTHYTLSGQTLTTVIALPTGTNLKVDYKK